MKSVTIKDRHGNLIFKVIHRKSGEYEVVHILSLQDANIDVRDDNGCKVQFDNGQAKDRR